MTEPLNRWQIHVPESWNNLHKKDQIIFLRLGAAFNALNASGRAVKQPCNNNPAQDAMDKMHRILWCMALVKETVITIHQHSNDFIQVCNVNSEIKALWDRVFANYGSKQADTLWEKLGRIRDNAAFHFDCRVFQQSSIVPSLKDVFVEGDGPEDGKSCYPLANAYVANWVFGYSENDHDLISRTWDELVDYMTDVRKLLQSLIIQKMKALGCLVEKEPQKPSPSS